MYEQIGAIPECRKPSDYRLVEIIMAGVAMFLFKQGSRNAMNNEREEPKFRKQYEPLFNARLPHTDTVEDVMEVLEDHHVERMKVELITRLLAKNVLRRYRLFGQ